MPISRSILPADYGKVYNNNWVPVFSAAGGTLTVQPTVNVGFYFLDGAWFVGLLDFTIDVTGVPTGACSATLPFTPVTRGVCDAIEVNNTGSLAYGVWSPAPSVAFRFTTGLTLFAANNRVVSGPIVFRR